MRPCAKSLLRLPAISYIRLVNPSHSVNMDCDLVGPGLGELADSKKQPPSFAQLSSADDWPTLNWAGDPVAPTAGCGPFISDVLTGGSMLVIA